MRLGLGYHFLHGSGQVLIKDVESEDLEDLRKDVESGRDKEDVGELLFDNPIRLMEEEYVVDDEDVNEEVHHASINEQVSEEVEHDDVTEQVLG
ncbi:hypothetical protein RIF29_26738 [Crotalaria pallida]|uniref:Uncharacterized protein n=1 Tax=Crotalaria pallida TaxID=3830 RepID=A0AAN9EN19_CROPI